MKLSEKCEHKLLFGGEKWMRKQVTSDTNNDKQ